MIEKLAKKYAMFLINDFDIDFTVDFPHLSSLSAFERSLIRLYHRIFIAHYAKNLSQKGPGKLILTNRSVYDSEAYINVYRKLGWISEKEFKKLDFIMKNFNHVPRVVVLNPPLGVLLKRLRKRGKAGSRMVRDKIFKKEDSIVFLKNLSAYFTKFKSRKNVLYIEDNLDKEIEKILAWSKTV